MINSTPPPENDQRKTAATIVPKRPFVVSHRPKNGQHLELPAFVTRTSLSRFSTDQTTIRADADYKVALRETSALMEFDPKLGTPDGDRLDVLATLVQAYEPPPIDLVTQQTEHV